MSLRGKVVVITGAARGVGRYVAGTFAREGCRLAIPEIDAERMASTAAELRALGAEVLTARVDVTDEPAVSAFTDRVRDHYGQLDVLVNNAGIVSHRHWGIRWPPVRDMEWNFWKRVIDTNLGGVFLCTKHALRHMRTNRTGHVLNIWGGFSREVVGNPDSIGVGAYSVSKVAVRKFTQFLAEEEREAGICILIVSPGGAMASEDAPDHVKARYPGPELVANRFVLAAEAPLEFSGKVVDLDESGRLVAINPLW
jgi:meso-butanediol dehydrogenase/(S,S)-butanediol dehydrogenase/diacetyl reductase